MIFNENNLPEYIKKTKTFIFLNGQTTWVGKLNNSKEFYGMPVLDYDDKGTYTIKNSCEVKVEHLLLDCYNEDDDKYNIDTDEFEVATKEEYEVLKNKIIEIQRIKLENKIECSKKELEALKGID